MFGYKFVSKIQIVLYQFVQKTTAKKTLSLKKNGPPWSPRTWEYVKSVLSSTKDTRNTWKNKSSVQHLKKRHILRNGTHLCSPGMFLCRTSCRNYAPELPFQLSYLVICSNWYKSTYRAHIDFFHTQNLIRSKSLTHCWKGENRGSNLHYFLAQESSIKADF